ncbi:MAG: signal peptidase I [Hadesarchaea archaeon]|nr:MAG: signal peptidase I [Hadesarchaea archaeon]TDA33594.1 MAG: signal peptidase I [Hadesarchaea archaeon]
MTHLSRESLFSILSFFLLLGCLYFAYQGILMLVFDSETPLMCVISDSMKHYDESWREVYEQRGENTLRFPFQKGFERGDLVVVKGISSPSELKVGDVVVYRQGSKLRVHRILAVLENGAIFITKGDANSSPDPPIPFEDVRGKVVGVIPNLGWLSLSVWRGY